MTPTAINPQDSKSSILVFPATHPDGRDYLEVARERDERVVAASSAPEDIEIAGAIEQLAILPYIYEANFEAEFLALTSKQNISRIFAPVSAVYSRIAKLIVDRNLPIRLIGESPFKREMQSCTREIYKARSYLDFIRACSGFESQVDELEIAATFRLAANIYGESNEHKIAAIIGIFLDAPKGDIVEIGSLAGKSAAVLAFLAKRHEIGAVLAIDPWRTDAAVQHDSPDTVRVDLIGEWDSETLVADFVINTLPIGFGDLNYIRDTAENAIQTYRDSLAVRSQSFGETHYTGKISVIHIDGNHDYANVKQDVALWCPLIANKGWMILDDYLWVHGDGPRRAGNELFAANINKIERAFVAGKALFLKFSETPS